MDGLSDRLTISIIYMWFLSEDCFLSFSSSYHACDDLHHLVSYPENCALYVMMVDKDIALAYVVNIADNMEVE